jgi:hypothetical protein
MYQPVSTGEAATKQQLESIRLIGEGCTQLRTFRDCDLYGYLYRSYGLDQGDFESLTVRSANKIIVALSSLFFQLLGQSQLVPPHSKAQQGTASCEA